MGIFERRTIAETHREFSNETRKCPRGGTRSRWDNTLGQTVLRKGRRRTSGGAAWRQMDRYVFLGDPHEVEAFSVLSWLIHFINAL